MMAELGGFNWERLYEHACKRLKRAMLDVDSSICLRFEHAASPRFISAFAVSAKGKTIAHFEKMSVADVVCYDRYKLRRMLNRLVTPRFAQ